MKKNVSLKDFIQGFKDFGMDYFTIEGYEVLYNYLIDLEEDTGREIDFDVIAICCDYSEYTFKELLEEFFSNDEDFTDLKKGFEQEILNRLREKTEVLEVENKNKAKTYIIRAF